MFLKLSIVILLFTIGAAAQVPAGGGSVTAGTCTLVDAPAWRGLKLGMSRTEFMVHFPGTNPVNMFKSGELLLMEKFQGLESLMFTFSNGKLDWLAITHDSSNGRPDDENFLRGLSSFLKLPAGAWKPGPSVAVMNCSTFRVNATANKIEFTDLAAEKIRKEMKRKAEEPARRN